jgi:hypothetical protein
MALPIRSAYASAVASFATTPTDADHYSYQVGFGNNSLQKPFLAHFQKVDETCHKYVLSISTQNI